MINLKACCLKKKIPKMIWCIISFLSFFNPKQGTTHSHCFNCSIVSEALQRGACTAEQAAWDADNKVSGLELSGWREVQCVPGLKRCCLVSLQQDDSQSVTASIEGDQEKAGKRVLIRQRHNIASLWHERCIVSLKEEPRFAVKTLMQ